MFCQLPVPPAGSIENFLLTATAVGSMVLIGKKLLARKPVPKESDAVSPADFRILRDRVEAVGDKIDARCLALSEKIERLGDSIHARLNQLEAGLARVDERTKD